MSTTMYILKMAGGIEERVWVCATKRKVDCFLREAASDSVEHIKKQTKLGHKLTALRNRQHP